MPFNVENQENSIVKFTFEEPFVTEDMKKVLALFSKLFEKKKPFAVYVDTRKANRPPFDAASLLIKWMRANKHLSKQYLICTAVVFSNTASSIVVKNLIQGVFKIQPTVRPNLLTSDFDRCVRWIKDKVVNYYHELDNEIINEEIL